MLRASESRKAAATPGMIPGIVIRQNVRNGVDPRSIAASSSVQSVPRTRAFTVIATKLRQNSVWAITIVQNPRVAPTLKNSVKSEAPITISGVVSGSISSRLMAPLPYIR